MRVPFAVAISVAFTWGTACNRTLPTTPTDGLRGVSTPATTGGRSLAAEAAQSALTLVDVTAGLTGTSNNYVGQSVTIPGHATYNRIRFNWYGYGATAGATAFGTLFLLDAVYIGPPDQLGTSTPGFVAASESIVGGQYVFDPKVKIKGGTKYWFYTETQGSFSTSFFDSPYPGGDMYITGMPMLDFHQVPAFGAPGVYVDANFRLDAKTDR